MRRHAWKLIFVYSCMVTGLAAIFGLHLSSIFAQSKEPSSVSYQEVLEIGRGSTNAVAWNPINSIIAVGGSFGVWLYSNQFQDIAHLSTDPVQALSWSPDGTMLAVGNTSTDGYATIQVWDGIAKKLIFTTPPALNGEVLIITWSPGGWLATADGNKIVMWEPHSQRNTLNIQGYKSQLVALAWSPDGMMLAGASVDNVVQIWNAATGNPITAFQQKYTSSALAWSPDSKLLASSGINEIHIWDIAGNTSIATLGGFNGLVWNLAWGKNRLASVGNDNVVRVWDSINTAQIARRFEGHRGFIYQVAWNPDGTQLISASADNTVQIWQAATGEKIATLQNHTGNIRALGWSPDGKKLASASRDDTIQVWNPDNGTLLLTLQGHVGTVYAVAWSPNGKMIATAGADGTVRLWDGVTGAVLNTLNGHVGEVRSIAWDPRSSHLASAGYDGTIRIWDVQTGLSAVVLEAHNDTTIDAIAWSRDGQWLAAGGQDGNIRVWKAGDWHLYLTISAHAVPVRALAWSPDSKRIVSASDDSTLQLWDAANGEHLKTFTGHNDGVEAVSWHIDGDIIASVGLDRAVHLWKVDSADDADIVIGNHDDQISAVAWSPDGTRLASGGWDDIIKIYAAQGNGLPSTSTKEPKPMSLKQYRCVVTNLIIRSQPQSGDQFKTGQHLNFGEIVTVDESSRIEIGGIVWIKHSRGWSAERSVDGKSVYLMDTSLRPKDRQWGINIDPNNPAGNPPAARLTGLGWVRFVFHYQSKYSSLDQAFAYYDPIIQGYQKTGTKVLLVLLQDTYGGNRPWLNKNNGWDVYTAGFAQTASAIAQHYKGVVSAYEIWNEGDVPAQVQTVQTSIYIPPEIYGPFLLATAQALKQADPTAKVVSGGLAGSDQVGYLTKVAASLQPPGQTSKPLTLPVDAIGIHPYGQTPPNGSPFVGWSQGSLGDAITRLSDTFPGIPLWITEIGVPRVDVTNQSFWPGIANYMNKTFMLVRYDYFQVVPVIIWFAWADSMDQAGIVTDAQQPKGAIFDAFMQCLHADQSAYTKPAATPLDNTVTVVHVAGQLVGEKRIGDLAMNISTAAPNVGAVLAKTSVGTSWQAQFDNKPGMSIGGPTDIGRWSAELTRYRMALHAWHEVVGSDTKNEVNLLTQVAHAPGISSIVLDLNPASLTLKNSDSIRAFMLSVRQALGASYPIGVSFDSRPDQFSAVQVTAWFPFINSWHPKIFHWQYSKGTQDPTSFFSATADALQPYPRPIIPMLQAEPSNGSPVPPAQIRQAGKLAFETYDMPGLSYYELGTIGPQEFQAIKGVFVPWTAGLIPARPAPDSLVVQTTAPLRIRSAPDANASILGTLQPNEQVAVLERRVVGAQLWVRHNRGWSLCRNGATGDIFMA